MRPAGPRGVKDCGRSSGLQNPWYIAAEGWRAICDSAGKIPILTGLLSSSSLEDHFSIEAILKSQQLASDS